MARRKKRQRPVRHRIGRVSYYEHHGGWWIYYREGGRPVRKRVADTEQDAERIAAQVQAQLSSACPTLLSFEPIQITELRDRFLAHHEDVLRSSVSTIRRYRAATSHLIDFADESLLAHELSAERFAAFLRHREVAPNGHPNTARRRLRDKGVRFILEVCRSMYGYAQRMRHLPPYAPNPFSQLGLERMRIEDARPVHVFTDQTELAFFRAADSWSFPIHFTLAKTGLRPGELTHLLIEEVDLEGGWIQVRNKVELGWRIKTGCERSVPLVPELRSVLSRVIGGRTAGPVFLRPKFVTGGEAPLSLDRRGLARLFAEQLNAETTRLGRALHREERLRVARSLWRDAGAIKADRIRTSFMRVTGKIGLPEATCPKSWRHSFATLLQDANVDPLIRQITLGHKPVGASGALGMTARYTHTRPQTQQQEIVRALRLWPESLAFAAAWAEGGASC